MADTLETPPQPLTHARVLRIALPIVLSNVTVPILGIVDVAVVGQMGAAAPIGAVAIGAIILSTAYWFFGFLRMGTVGLVGQAVGAGDDAEASATLSRALLIALGAGLSVMLLLPAIIWLAFSWDPTSPEVEAMARAYLHIRVLTAPCAIAVYALTGWLIAMERTSAVFVTQLVMNGVNILLDLWFVLGLGWSVEGVAVATAIAEISGALTALWLCRSAFAHPAWKDRARLFDRAALRRMAALNGDILIRSLLLMSIFVFVTFAGARFGDVTLAANEVLLQFLHIAAFALDGFAFAAESLVARAMGRKDPARLRRAAILCAVWAFGVGLVLTLCFALAGGLLIDLMAKDPDVQAMARTFLPWVVAAPLLGCAAWILDGVFVGATRGRDMRNMMILSFLAFVAAALLLVPLWGNQGLWAALLVSFVARGVTLGWRYPDVERAAAAKRD